MRRTTLILLTGVLAGCIAASPLDSVVFQVKPGMTEGDVRAILKPHTLDSGTVYWGGSGARRLYFQISKTEQVWVEMAGGPDGKTMEVGKPETKQEWTRGHGDSITVKTGPTTPRTVPSPAPGAGEVR